MDLERQLGDLIADDRITEADAEAVRTFRDFLTETPAGVVKARASQVAALFPDRAAFEAWRARWLPYLAGLADAPSTPQEWPAYREQIMATHTRHTLPRGSLR